MAHYMMLLACLLVAVNCHIYRDHWMNTNKIDPDYMHYKAMHSLSRAKVVEERVRVDDISAKQI